MLNTPEAHKELSNFGKRVVIRARRNFTKNRYSGKGSKSIKYEIQRKGNGYELIFSMLPYVWFQDAGVKGSKSSKNRSRPIAGERRDFKYTNKMPPPRVFDKWTVRRGIAPRDDKGRFLPRRTLNFLIARKIFLYGIRPKLFFTKAFEKEWKRLPDDLAGGFGTSFENILKD